MPGLLILDAEADRYRALLHSGFPDLRMFTATTPEAALPHAAMADVMITRPRLLTPALIAGLTRLGLLQLLVAGTDGLDRLQPLAARVVIASLRGIHGPQMAELALMLMLALVKRLPDLIAQQRGGGWGKEVPGQLAGRHLVIAGTGSVAEAVATRAQAFGMRVTGLSRSPRAVAGFDAVRPLSDLADLAAVADVLTVLTPATEATRHLISADVLARMPRHALLISLSRGAVVDEAALTLALQQGRIAGTGLDVFAAEPLAADSPLRQMANVIVTPHVGGLHPDYPDQAMAVLRPNLRAFLAGDIGGLRNVVSAPGGLR